MEKRHRPSVLVVDVDGTMTDGGVYYDSKGNELKKFCVRDAAGILAAQKVGIEIVVLTGRKSAAAERRMAELGVTLFFQGVIDKEAFLREYMSSNRLASYDVGYLGDDLNDLPAMGLAGFVGCPSDSCAEVIARADYVSRIRGGNGAVRDIVEQVLRNSGEWEAAVSSVYGIGV